MDLITGPFRPSLESAFREAFAARRAQDPLAPLAVVAASRRMADRLKALALEACPRGVLNVRFHNLFTFAREIYDETAPEEWTLHLDDLVPERLVRAVLRRHFREERYLSRAALAPKAVLGALHELKAAGVRPETAIGGLLEGELGVEDAGKLAELLALYKRYTDELRRRKIHERADVVRWAVEKAESSAFLGGLRHVFYYGFYELDQNQIDLFEKVVRRVPSTVFFPHAGRPEYAYAGRFLEEIVSPKARTTRGLPSSPPVPKVRVIAASGAHDEVWAAAKEVLRLADAGVPLGEIGVVARTLDPFLQHVEAVFREHRIPFASSGRRRLDHDPRVKAARLLFTLDDFDRGRVLDLLRSPFFRRPGGDPELWDAASRLMGIGHGAEEWRRRLGEAAGKDWEHAPAARAGGRRFVLPRADVDFFWASVRGLIEAPPPPETGWTAYAAWALDRLKRFLEPDARIEAAVKALEGLEGFALEDPLETLLRQLAELAEPAGGAAGVQVLDAMAARGLPFRALVVLGMNERVFPRYILEDAFLRDAVRARLTARLGNRLPRKQDGYEEERLLFEMLRGASDEIVLTYQRSDDRGRLQIPSPYLPAAKAEQVARRPSDRLREAPFERLTPREASLRTGQGEALGRALGWDVETLVNAQAFLERIEARGAPGSCDGLVDTSRYWAAVAGFGLSPSALERLAECPFRFFAGRMMDLEELEEPEGEEALSPLEIGLIYHDVLERYHRHGDLDRQMEAAFGAFEAARSIRYPVLWEVERDRMRKVLRAFVDADDCTVYKPVDFERELKAAIPLAVGGRKEVVFRGFVDRLDAAADGSFRVVDYKKSKGKYPWKMETGVFDKGRYLQPPIYFLLAQAVLGVKDPSGCRFSYYFLEQVPEGEPWEMRLEGESMGERWDDLEEHLVRLLETIPAGRFAIRPGDYCSGCDYRTMCRKSHLPTRLRAQEAAYVPAPVLTKAPSKAAKPKKKGRPS